VKARLLLLLLLMAPGSVAPSSMSMPSVDFRLSDLTSKNPGVRAWLVHYGPDSAQTQFEIRLNMRTDTPDSENVSGVVVRHAPSDARRFLAALAEVHHARGIALAVPHIDSLTFEGILVGSRLSRRGGAASIAKQFSRTALGTWFVLDVSLLPELPDRSRVFLAMSPLTGEGALVPVSMDQGPGVVAAFSGVLW